MASSPLPAPPDLLLAAPSSAFPATEPLNQAPPPPPPPPPRVSSSCNPGPTMKPNQVGQVILYGIPIVSLVIDGQERLCLAQISNTLLKTFSYNEIHNRRVALGITCVQCTPVQLEILRRAGAMPISSRRCGMITKREAERLCKSFLGENRPPKLPDNFAFDVSHECAWGCRGSFIPARYNSSRAKCIKCSYCSMYFSPNKFIFHSHRTPEAKYTQPDAANFNSWRRHLKLTDKSPPDELVFAWEDVKAMFNGGSRKRALPTTSGGHHGVPNPAVRAGGGGGGSGGGPGVQPHCHPLKAVVGVGGGLLSPHLLGAPPPPPPPPPELHLPKRGRFLDDDEDLQEAVAAAAAAAAAAVAHSSGKGPRNYPVIPVPSKGGAAFGGVLQKFPACGGLFPHPYSFPAAAAFSLCHKKEDIEGLVGAPNSATAGPKGVGSVASTTTTAGATGASLSGLFWPTGRKEAATAAAAAAAAFYPPFCMFWPPRTPGGLPGLPTYLQPPPPPPPPQPPLSGESPGLLRQTFLDLGEPNSEGNAAGLGTPPTAASNGATSGSGGFDSGEGAHSPEVEGAPTAPQTPLLEGQPRSKSGSSSSYHHSSAFRPVGGKEDSESLAKLHHHHHHHHHPHSSSSSPPQPPAPPPPLLLLPPEPSGHRLLSPAGTTCSYPSEESSGEEDEEEEEEGEEEEPEVDVEGHHKAPEEEEELEEEEEEMMMMMEDEEEEEGREAEVLVDPVRASSRYPVDKGLPVREKPSKMGSEEGKVEEGPDPQLLRLRPLPPPPPPPPPAPQDGGSPREHPSAEEPPYKEIQKSKEGNQVVVSLKENNFSDKNKEHSFFITESEHPAGDFWRNIAGEPIQETNPPHSLKKDVENMGKEELQKVLFEQIDLRRRLEQEFQVLKGTASFPVFNNFQDQMKRELAYREEMVQQLQIIPYAASLIRKEKLGAHLSKS